MRRIFITITISLILLLFAFAAYAQNLTPKERLGGLIYFDSNLSYPPRESCSSCHHPDAGFADPNHTLPVSRGAVPDRFGSRSSPTSAYAAFCPPFHYDSTHSQYLGGQFWDGRANSLAEQAMGPFLNPLEMNNGDAANVVGKISQSSYAGLFQQVFGQEIFGNTEAAYESTAVAIAAYESTDQVNSFTSKYDLYLAGQVQLTNQEHMGMMLFNSPMQGNCAFCHPSTPGPYSDHPLFTKYTYENLGIPKNWQNPFLTIRPHFNPDGMNFIDYGLGGRLAVPAEMGKFKIPSLRNIARTAPYGHNGYFQTLTQILNFYNTRDVQGAGWPDPEVPQNVNTEQIGNMGLMPCQISRIVAFLNTLTDGYNPSQDEAADAPVIQAAITGLVDLVSAYPNPFNPTTTISYQLPGLSRVSLKVYDTAGRLVASLADGWRDAGPHEVTFDASRLPSGIYLYRLQAGNQAATGKIVLMK